ncbi:MAG: hypothetical protein ABI687_05140 [Flavitalea sp.]
MRNIRNLSRIKSIIRYSGLTVKNSASVDYPIAVAVFYRNGSDGTVSRFWPKGNRQTALSMFCSSGSRIVKWTVAVYSLCFALGLESFLAHGKLVLYTDLPTATYLRNQWEGKSDLPKA